MGCRWTEFSWKADKYAYYLAFLIITIYEVDLTALVEAAKADFRQAKNARLSPI